MKINKIELKNIGPHKDTSIDLMGKPSIVAITGENGAGKTYLIEAVPAALYGAFPTRPGSIYDRITNGFEGESSIDFDFEMNGDYYKVNRTLKRSGKTTTAQAYLGRHYQNMEEPGGREELIAGPKVKDFEQAVENLLGSQASFLASVFSSQQNTGDICDARPAERKAVFSRMLGLERYDQLSTTAKDKAKDMQIQLDGKETNVKGLRERAEGLAQAQTDLQSAIEAQEAGKRNLEEQRSKVADLEAKVKEGEIAVEKWRALDSRLKQLDDEIRRAELDIEADRAEYKRLKGIIDRADDIIKAENDLQAVIDKKDKLQERLQEVEKGNSEKQLEYERRLSDAKATKIGLDNRREAMRRMSEQASLLDKTPNQECCQRCVLVASAVKAANEMPAAQKAMDEAEKKAGKIDTAKPVLQDTLTMKSTLSEYLREIDEIKKLTADAPKLREAQGSMKTMVEAGKAKTAALNEKKAERDNVKRETLEEWELTGLSNEKVKEGGLRHDLEIAKHDQKIFEDKLSGIVSRIGAIKERITGMAKDVAEADRIEEQLSGSRQMISDLKEVERAFGRSGIQPLIIEQARPELEDIADQMLLAATEGKMRVRFETQKELKSGDMAESLDIVVSRDGFDLDIGELSGGEQKLIRMAVRLTLAVWQARRGGNRLRTLFIDEVFDSLDAENSERVLKLLESLTGQFDKIILISHDDDLLAELPARINLTKGHAETII